MQKHGAATVKGHVMEIVMSSKGAFLCERDWGDAAISAKIFRRTGIDYPFSVIKKTVKILAEERKVILMRSELHKSQIIVQVFPWNNDIGEMLYQKNKDLI